MSKIQWTDDTANPIKRADDGGNYCEMVSPGCARCYASTLNAAGTRFGGNGLKFGGANQDRPEMTLNVDMVNSWSRMRKARKIFVGSMTGIAGPWVPDWMVYALFAGMANAPRQTFQLLTKRPERMAELVGGWLRQVGLGQLPKNIWLGTSAEDQKRLDERLTWLMRSLAQVTFLSLEPLLGPIRMPTRDMPDWIIIGGESGHNARPLHLSWIEDILEQCRAAGIPAFVKQMGSHWGGAAHSKGGEPEEWPMGLRVRMFPGEVWRGSD
jgi:protein gp37